MSPQNSPLSTFGPCSRHTTLTPAEAKRRLGLIRGTVAWEGFNHIDLVIEAVVEDPGAKRAIFAELEARTKPTAVLATNTSSLSVATHHIHADYSGSAANGNSTSAVLEQVVNNN